MGETLSDKRCKDADSMYPNVVYAEKDVKIFIKNILFAIKNEDKGELRTLESIERIIKEKAGEKLI